MIEIVADALTKAFDREGRVFDAGQAEDLARAAIKAMREPTDQMKAACWPNHHPWGKNAPNPSDRPDMFQQMDADVTADWQAMIDAALSQAIGNKESGDDNAS